MNKYLGELLGTFVLVFAGTGAIIVDQQRDGVIGHLGIALAFGIVVMTMIYSLGDLSGAHLNPAVSLGFWFLKLFSGKDLVMYTLSQLMGALLASLLWKWIFPMNEYLGATMPSIPVLKAFVMELILTFLLMFTIVHVSQGAKEKGIMAGISIGGMVALEALFAGPLTGASMNPARSFGPALASGHLTHLWLYFVATCLGALLACFTCKLLRGKNCCNGEKTC